MENLQKYLDIALEAARAAAKVLLKNFGTSGDWQVKGNSKGLVTKTDMEAEQVILDILSTKTDFSILSEESGLFRDTDGPIWVVDPLDGTNNFAHGLPFFAVSIGLMQGNESLLGVIIAPLQQKEFTAIKNGGTYLNSQKIKLTPFSREYIPSVFLNHGYAQPDRDKFKVLTHRLAANNNLLKLGTTAQELMYLAQGSVDAFICSGDELWDFAAGIVLVCEAGYIFTDWKGNKWDGESNKLLFARPEIHSALVNQICDLQ